uniref:ATP synthase complex subunit 8 n=1 Tax=Gelasimus borealis TaxID=626958 RepID=A0A344GDH1_9EUCA|nr:ATP synthase F0 subunit 8 [Gelasimus borealis]AXA13741.1 ATP synthase F0 subunit 8 [Gelasimus borealis]AZZ73246.1 ATP synthase F0 subunit 8 [Gelasimus borealis]
MPQMAPLYWLLLFFFFLLVLLTFFMMNYFIKPFEKKDYTMSKPDSKFKAWTL